MFCSVNLQSACQETAPDSATCTGGADEARTTIGYGPQVAGTGNTLLPVAVARGSGDGVATPVATTAYGYDAIGNLTSVDGPRSGTADVATYRYDGARRAVGAVSADPDGAGPLKPRAVRTTYDAKDRATLVEQGNVTSASDADWAGFAALQSVARDYDGIDRPVKETLSAGGTTYGVSQYSYFADGPLECATQRMNPDTWDAPGPVCDAGADGAYGRDRVVRLFRNPSGQVVRRRVGIGSDASLSDQTVGYTLNGQIVRVTDGELDRTTFVYDGFDRLIRTRYPVATVGADTSATSDDEQVVYDASGNVVTLIQRDDVTTTFTYDALGRRMREDIAGSDPDIDYRYDLLGRLRSATAPGQPGRAYAYDARGNVTIHSGPYGYRVDTYDVADRRVRRTWSDDTNQVPPDAFFVTYDYLETGEVAAIREAGAPVLASFGYDALGRRVRVGRGDGSVTTYGYDAGSRLTALAHDLTGTANDVGYTFAYNPAGQITSETRDNDAAQTMLLLEARGFEGEEFRRVRGHAPWGKVASGVRPVRTGRRS